MTLHWCNDPGPSKQRSPYLQMTLNLLEKLFTGPFTNIRYSIGPNIEPCGTPLGTVTTSGLALILTPSCSLIQLFKPGVSLIQNSLIVQLV